jgi:HSP20 family molecular chaperone IbpA
VFTWAVFFRVARPLAWPDARENEMTITTSWDLFEDLRAAQDEVMRTGWGRARRFGQQYDADAGAMAWAPAIEISERKDVYMVSAELPGVSAGEVEITFGDGLPLDHPARPHPGGEDRGYGTGRRAAGPGAQGTGRTGQAHPRAGRPARGRGHVRREGQRELTIPGHRPPARGLFSRKPQQP